MDAEKTPSAQRTDLNFQCCFTVLGDPIGKPRQTQSDRWNKRDVVVRYREWADECRLAATGDRGKKIEEYIFGIIVFCHYGIPETWSEKKKEQHYGRMSRQGSDADNTLKACMDALFQQDKAISMAQSYKFWCEKDGEPRVDIFLLSFPQENEARFISDGKKKG